MTVATRRGGFAVVAVLVLVAIVGVLLTGWARYAVAERRHARTAHVHTQAEWLAASTLSIAVRQLEQDPNYSGGEWRLTAEQIGQAYAAHVVLQVEATTQGRRVTATVDLPPGDKRVVRHHQSIVIPDTPQGES